MAITWSTVGLILYYIILPILLLLRGTVYLLSWIAAPVRHVAYYIIHALLFPFRFLARFETLFIYFGVAALVGTIAGAFVYFTLRILSNWLRLDKPPNNASSKGHWKETKTMESYRQRRRDKQKVRDGTAFPDGLQTWLDDAPMEDYSDWMKLDPGGPKSPIGLMSTTILEEDSSEIGF